MTPTTDQPGEEGKQIPAGVLSMDVDCPWCQAKAGEPCYIQVPYVMKLRSGNGIERPKDRFHLARVKPGPEVSP